MRRLHALALTALLIAFGAPTGLAQDRPARQPLIAEALIDLQNRLLVINGYDFPVGPPRISLGMNALAVLDAGANRMVAPLPELAPGTYLLAAAWPDGNDAMFYLTVGAVGPAGPRGPRGVDGRDAGTRAAAGLAAGAAEPHAAQPTAQDHAGSSNTHYGARALESVTSGRNNAAFGDQALRNLSSGEDNAAFGRAAMLNLTTGTDNLAIGTNALRGGTDASFNIALGSGALENTALGRDNVGLGSAALLNAQGDENIAIGRNALRNNADGSGNTAIGFEAGIGNRTGSNNVYIGSRGENGDEGVIRIGNPNVHTKTVLVGDVEGNFDVKAVPVYQ